MGDAIEFLMECGWLLLVICVALVGLTYFGVFNLKEPKEEYKYAYDYCVEWGGWIDRHDLFFNCYDLSAGVQKCSYIILNETLTILTSDNRTFNFNCSIFLDSKTLIE